jgi:hypothetical protein
MAGRHAIGGNGIDQRFALCLDLSMFLQSEQQLAKLESL